MLSVWVVIHDKQGGFPQLFAHEKHVKASVRLSYSKVAEQFKPVLKEERWNFLRWEDSEGSITARLTPVLEQSDHL